MSQDVLFQAKLFALSVVWGSGLMLAYDGLRLVRIFIRQKKWLQASEEILFWLAASGCIYALLYRYNNGAVRNYIVCGMGTGMVLYRGLLSSVFIRYMSAVLRPVRKICLIFKTFVKNAENTLQSALTKRKMKHKKLRQEKREEHNGV